MVGGCDHTPILSHVAMWFWFLSFCAAPQVHATRDCGACVQNTPNYKQIKLVSISQAAKKQDPSFLEKFAIFSREQEHTQKESGAKSGESAVDLVRGCM